MHRSGSVSQFDSSLREYSTFPYDHGSSAILSHNASIPQSPHQYNNSRELHRDHCNHNGSASQVSQHMHRSGSVSQVDSRLRELCTFPYNHGARAILSLNESMQRSPHQCNNSHDLNRNHCIRNGSASQVSQHMHRSESVSQFDLSFRESSILPYNLGSSAVLARNESMVRSPYQCNNSRDLERNHCGKHEQHSFGFSCPQISISY